MGMKTDLILLMDSTKNMVKTAHLGDSPKLKEAIRIRDVRYNRFLEKYDVKEVQPMDEEQARKILDDYIREDNRLISLNPYVYWQPFLKDIFDIQLDGVFDIDELEAFAWWMKNKGVQPMTDKEFDELKANIQETMNRLIDLQKQYLQETGRSYVINGPNP